MGDVILGVVILLLIVAGLALLVVGIAAARGQAIDRRKTSGH